MPSRSGIYCLLLSRYLGRRKDGAVEVSHELPQVYGVRGLEDEQGGAVEAEVSVSGLPGEGGRAAGGSVQEGVMMTCRLTAGPLDLAQVMEVRILPGHP